MASGVDDFEEIVENLKVTIRKSFTFMYASLKARELKTIRQLDAIRKQCQNNKDLQRNCVGNIQICYNNESTLLENISKYGEINLEKLSFDNNTFILEDYISPNDDHMYSYKTLEELTIEDSKELEAIEEAALKQITDTEDCVCVVTVNAEEVSKKFRDLDDKPMSLETPNSNENDQNENVLKSLDNTINHIENEHEGSECSDPDIKKINPTDDWLNSIKSQTETEPSQVTDVMEHSTITCS